MCDKVLKGRASVDGVQLLPVDCCTCSSGIESLTVKKNYVIRPLDEGNDSMCFSAKQTIKTAIAGIRLSQVDFTDVCFRLILSCVNVDDIVIETINIYSNALFRQPSLFGCHREQLRILSPQSTTVISRHHTVTDYRPTRLVFSRRYVHQERTGRRTRPGSGLLEYLKPSVSSLNALTMSFV